MSTFSLYDSALSRGFGRFSGTVQNLERQDATKRRCAHQGSWAKLEAGAKNDVELLDLHGVLKLAQDECPQSRRASARSSWLATLSNRAGSIEEGEVVVGT